MTQVERRDKAPEPKEEKPEKKTSISRREFLVGSGAGIAGLVIGGVVAREAFPKTVEVVKEITPEAPVAATEAPGEAVYKAGYTLVFDPVQCTGCMLCAVACAEK